MPSVLANAGPPAEPGLAPPSSTAAAAPPAPAMAWAPAAQPHLPGLDGLRAVAVLVVFFYHAGVSWVPGNYGVVLFFVLSGFLITRLLLAELDRSGAIDVRNFWYRRFLRIVPPFWAYIAVVAALGWFVHRPLPASRLVGSLLYLTNYQQAVWGDPNDGLSITWSLAVEEQFYVLWPFALLAIVRLTPRRSVGAIAAAVVAVWTLRAFLVLAAGVPGHYVYNAFETRADALLVGCALALAATRGVAIGPIRWLTRGAPQVAATVLFLVAATAVGVVADPPHYRDVFGHALIAVGGGALVLQAVALSRTGCLRVLELAPVRWVGRLSYSFYLYHSLAIGPVLKRLDGAPRPVQLAAALAGALALASCSYYAIERPIAVWRARARRAAVA